MVGKALLNLPGGAVWQSQRLLTHLQNLQYQICWADELALYAMHRIGLPGISPGCRLLAVKAAVLLLFAVPLAARRSSQFSEAKIFGVRGIGRALIVAP